MRRDCKNLDGTFSARSRPSTARIAPDYPAASGQTCSACPPVLAGRILTVKHGLADLLVLMTGGVQFGVGGVLEREQGVVRVRQGQQDLVELALGRPLMPRWVCWMTKTIASVSAATRVWKTVSHRAGNPAARLIPIHVPAAPRTSTATTGRDASRSIRDSHRLTADLDRSSGGPCPAVGPGGRGLLFAEFPGELIAAHLRPARQVTFLGDLVQFRPGLG